MRLMSHLVVYILYALREINMKIVVLDGYSANPGDLSWDELKAMGEVTVYDRTSLSETVARAAEAEVVLTNKVVIGREEMAQLQHLKYIGVLATGYNVVDIEAAHERGITVTNVPAYSTESVAQMVFAHLLTVTNRTEHMPLPIVRGDGAEVWTSAIGTSHTWNFLARRLASSDLEISVSVWLPSPMLSACESVLIPVSRKVSCLPTLRRSRRMKSFQRVTSSACIVR